MGETANRGGVAVAVVQGESRLYASAGGDAGFSRHTPVVVGCLAKCLTAALLAEAAASARIRMHDEIAELIALRSSRVRRTLGGIRVAHLLNHTHGLDGSAIDTERMPRRADGRVDMDVLCAEVAAVPRIAVPGETYSYGGVGYWLAAGLLEQLHQRAYGEVLQDWLRESAGLEMASRLPAGDICPAWGRRLALSAADLLEFLRLQLTKQDEGAPGGLELMRQGRVDMPGWGPWQKAAVSGWNVYGDEWFGHNGNRDHTGIALRFHATEALAIVVTAERETDCFAALGRLFGDVLEEFSRDYVRFPRPVSAQARRSGSGDAVIGCYENAGSRIRIAASQRVGFYRMTVSSRGAVSAPTGASYLRPAENGVFMNIPMTADFPFVQFVGNVAIDERPGFLWNGRELWKSVG